MSLEKKEVVITYLEMVNPPHHVIAPSLSENLLFLHLNEATDSFYRYLYFSLEQNFSKCEEHLLDEMYINQTIHHPQIDIYVLYCGGVPAGFSEIDRRNARDFELTHFGIFPEYAGRNLSLGFLKDTLNCAWNYNPQKVLTKTSSLETPKNLTLYQKIGFSPYKQKKKNIDIPTPNYTFTLE